MRARSPTKHPATAKPLAGKRVTVVGLGRFGGGVGVTRWLCDQRAKVTVSDKAESTALSKSIDALEGLPVALHLGSHDERDFLEADLLVINPAVPKDLPLLIAAEAAGVPRTSEINLFLQRCPAPVVGITGTAGKSTTTAMTGAILANRYTTHVGGNIGRSLLGSLPNITPDHVVVLELSSFQLEDTPLIGISPHAAVVTNLIPNHLDRHGTMEVYAAAKKNIFRFQSRKDVLILNASDAATAAWGAEAPGRVEMFDPQAEPFELAVPGAHNQANAQAAWLAGCQFGIDRAGAAASLRAFAGLLHRLQLVAERRGVRYYNDSKCTTPAGAVTALEVFAARTVIIIVGGYDRGENFDELGAALAGRAKAVIALGATQEKIIAAVRDHRTGQTPPVQPVGDLPAAVSLAGKLTGPGDVVLLSPACPSYDMFVNYEQRGQVFVQLVTG